MLFALELLKHMNGGAKALSSRQPDAKSCFKCQQVRFVDLEQVAFSFPRGDFKEL
jgi:hypothetical protein